ncbi:hypothetical protein, partial [Lelliottia wanjuensis]|uniref:hypothetical protein n=1 Tax=Lelliottia wanjuensis TaxID=3050585 RepID=UPI00254E770B
MTNNKLTNNQCGICADCTPQINGGSGFNNCAEAHAAQTAGDKAAMNNKLTGLRYGHNAQYLLSELASYDADDIDGDEFEVYGEDSNGREGSATISITELAADAAKLLAAKDAELQEYRNAQQHPAATLYNGSGRVSVMMVSDLPAGEVDVYTTPQPVP